MAFTIKTKLIKTLLSVLLISSLCGCSGENEVKCHDSLYLAPKEVTGPAAAGINETITFNVSFEVQSSCGNFVEFDEEAVSANEKKIAIKAEYDGCSCIVKPITRIAIYSFSAATAGTYTLKFKINSVTFITKTIVVS